jgi:hypothetical protein
VCITGMYVCLHFRYAYVCRHLCACVFIFICMFDVYMHLFVMSVYVHIYFHMYICTHICVNISDYIYTYIYSFVLYNDILDNNKLCI